MKLSFLSVLRKAKGKGEIEETAPAKEPHGEVKAADEGPAKEDARSTEDDEAERQHPEETRSRTHEENESIETYESAFERLMNDDTVPEEEVNEFIKNLSLKANKNFFNGEYDLALKNFDRTLTVTRKKGKTPLAYRELTADIMLRKGKIFQSSEKFNEAMHDYCIAIELYRQCRKDNMKALIESYVKQSETKNLSAATDQMNQKISLVLVSMGDAEVKMKNMDIAAALYDGCYSFLRYLWHGRKSNDENLSSKDKESMRNMLSMLHKIEIIEALCGNLEASNQAQEESQYIESTFLPEQKKDKKKKRNFKSKSKSKTVTASEIQRKHENNPYSIDVEEIFDADVTIDRLLILVNQDREEKDLPQAPESTTSHSEDGLDVSSEDLLELATGGISKKDHDTNATSTEDPKQTTGKEGEKTDLNPNSVNVSEEDAKTKEASEGNSKEKEDKVPTWTCGAQAFSFDLGGAFCDFFEAINFENTSEEGINRYRL